MSVQVDEDALSEQLESSLTLEDGECPSPNKSISRETDGRLGSKTTPLKAEKDLRKEVLIRRFSMSTPKKQIISGDFTCSPEHLTSPHQDTHQQPETRAFSDNFIVLDEVSCFPVSGGSVKPELPLKESVAPLETVAEKSDSKHENSNQTPPPMADDNEAMKPTRKKSGLDTDYISSDPSENADNNNPDWLLLQKLQTDDERYKAVRERWRNLIVPAPNKDLTCFTWCRKTIAPEKKDLAVKPNNNNRSEFKKEEEYNRGRKRTLSVSELDSPVRRGREIRKTEKRVRTVSCARIYDDKIANLRRHASEECLKINREHMSALEGLHREYVSVKRSLSNWSLSTGHSISQKLNDLERQHHFERRKLASSFEDLSDSVWKKQSSKLNALEAASAEVLAFHKFYQGLDQNAPEAMSLTEDQAAEISEINAMYDAFYVFYEE